MVLRGATLLLGALEGVGPRNDVAPLKTIMYHAIKTTDTLIVINNTKILQVLVLFL
jgi:hypothetical protein